MSKYNTHRASSKERKSLMNAPVHPIWRGIGFAFMILAPLMSYLLVDMFITENSRMNWIVFPANLIVKQWPQDPLILVKVIGILGLSIVLLSIFQLVYFIIMRFIAPPRYGPLDARRK
jgi:hypothetical protein